MALQSLPNPPSTPRQIWTIPFNELDIFQTIGEGSFGRVFVAK